MKSDKCVRKINAITTAITGEAFAEQKQEHGAGKTTSPR